VKVAVLIILDTGGLPLIGGTSGTVVPTVIVIVQMQKQDRLEEKLITFRFVTK
jgi:hypothetical protein